MKYRCAACGERKPPPHTSSPAGHICEDCVRVAIGLLMDRIVGEANAVLDRVAA